ncbi:PleD family two-component system response regulator [Glaciecola sp. SC05]|uniref:response regulator n=1 Tax=Glaciecola sp. SC05 TaxID=1987355 RepID=UPI0035279CD1
MTKHRILLVDDSPNELRILMEVLKHKYAIVVATNGEQAIKMVTEDKDIELVLLDVNMPVMSGYDTCKSILEIAPELPVLFVSANDSTDEILKGFDVGGVDYLTKPIDTNVVARKVDVIVNERELFQQLQIEHKNTSDMVMSVIASAGHLGTVLGFLRSGLKIKTHEGLVSALFDVFDNLNMDVCAQLRTSAGAINRATRGILTPLEEDLLNRASKMSGRFLEKGSRYIINFESVSVIVKNMPMDNETLKGDLRDNLMMILEDTDALNQKLSSTPNPKHESSLQQNVRECVQDAASNLEMLAKQQKNNQASLETAIDELKAEFEKAFFTLGLLEQQEETLTAIVESKAESLSQNVRQGEEIEDAIVAVQQQLTQVL